MSNDVLMPRSLLAAKSGKPNDELDGINVVSDDDLDNR
jgi:hypothetical protein